jgi:hypothetical protein
VNNKNKQEVIDAETVEKSIKVLVVLKEGKSIEFNINGVGEDEYPNWVENFASPQLEGKGLLIGGFYIPSSNVSYLQLIQNKG